MDLRQETLEIFKQTFGADKALTVLEFIESRVPYDVATQRDIYELKLEIEKVRGEVQQSHVSILKWNFGFWISIVALLTTILFKLFA